MKGLSCLADPKATLVCDASTIINLNATGCAKEILRALPNPLAISDIVLDELQEDVRSNRNDARLVAELQDMGLVRLLALDDQSAEHFAKLVSGKTINTLDDGEAATIACGIGFGAVPIVDERKANRICGEFYPQLLVGSTMDILAHEAIASSIGVEALTEAIMNALQFARMRVLPKHLAWVVELLGSEKASSCESLPASVRARGRIQRVSAQD